MNNSFTFGSHHQHRQFSVNLWAGMLGYCVIGLYILPARVSGRDCSNFLGIHLNGLLEGVSFNPRLEVLQ
jgi:hypothetical protein